MQKDLKSIVFDFIHTLQHRTSFEDLLPFYHPDAVQMEFPNLVTKTKATRNLNDLKAASERGSKLLQKEEYEVVHIYTDGNTVIVEANWTGTLAVALGDKPAGAQIKAFFAQFFEFQEDKIIRQRNYDCFEPL